METLLNLESLFKIFKSANFKWMFKVVRAHFYDVIMFMVSQLQKSQLINLLK